MEEQESILIVDDDRDLRETLTLLFEGKGYSVDSAASSREAIEKVRSRSFNIALLDIILPDMDGVELLSCLKDIRPQLAVVMITGHASTETAVKALNLGASAYITKPVGMKEIVNVVRETIEKQKLVIENRRLYQEAKIELAERKRAEERIEHINGVLRAMRKISQLVTAQKDHVKLLRDICQTLVKVPGYYNAGIALLDSAGEISRCVDAGLREEFLPMSEYLRQGEASACIHKSLGQHDVVIINSTGVACTDCQLASTYYGRTGMCVELAYNRTMYGVLCVAITPDIILDEEAKNLFKEVAGDISFALYNKELEEKHLQAEEEILHHQQMDRMKTELLSSVSHELRTPLATIKGYCSMILDYYDRLAEEEKLEYLKSIDGASDRLIELIDHLIDMSRLESGLINLEQETIDIAHLLKETVTEARLRAPEHKIVLQLPKVLPKVYVDSRRIRQVMDNIINNAVSYSEAGTTIKIQARPEKSELLISVADEGIGIPPREIEKVFERMYRVENEQTANEKGLGLGLAICRGLVEKHGGRIWIRSKLGQGSIVYFTLPIAVEE